MNNMKKLFSAVVLALFAAVPSANASLIFTLNTVFNGTSPNSTLPWLTATFENAGANTVTLTLNSSLSDTSEFFRDVTFNVNASIVPSTLAIVEGAHVGSAAASINKAAQNAQSVQGGGNAGSGFDVELEFATANQANNRFDGNDVAVFTITRAGLTENDFNFTNTGSANAYLAAHVQGIRTGEGSGAIKAGPPVVINPHGGVPEPASLALLGLGLAGLGFSRRKKQKSA